MEKLDYQLMKLGNKLDYWRWKYEASHPFFKSEYFVMYEKAKVEYAEYFRANYPNAKIEPKEFKKEIRMSDWTEVFEEYAD